MSVRVVSDSTPFVIGDAFTITFTLLTDQAATNLTGATITSTVSYYGQDVISAHSMSIVDAPTGVCSLAISAAESASLHPGPHSGDVKTVIAAVTKHYGPYDFEMRSPITT